MSSTDKELEEQITEVGNKLLQPPASIDELLILLDRVECCLSKVEQSPPKSIHDALSPLMKALVASDFLTHSDDDVKVAVASCISEITRITAPDAPYDDDKMKDIFKLIVSSFENLHDRSSRSYNKRVLILETVSKVRSCVVMLDLECDGLISEMFQHFFEAIREFHLENVFSSMAIVMNLVLEESEEVSLELLTPLLASVKKDNKVKPIVKKLGETVLANSAVKLRPYLKHAVESLNISLDEYDTVVTSVLEGTVPAVDHVDDSVPKDLSAAESKLADVQETGQETQVDGNKVVAASSDEGEQMAESVKEEASSEDTDPAVNRSPKSITSNGVSLERVGSVVETECSTKAENHDGADLQDAAKIPSESKAESDDSKAGKPTKSEKTAKKRGPRTNSSMNSAESSHQAPDNSEKEAEKLPENPNKDDRCSASEDPAVVQSNSMEKEPETTLEDAAPKESDGQAVNVAPSSPDQSLPEKSAPKKGRPKKKRINQEEGVPKKASEATSVLEGKQVKSLQKRSPIDLSNKEENEGGSSIDAETNKKRQSGKKMSDTKRSPLDLSHKDENEGGSTSDAEANKKRQSGKKMSDSKKKNPGGPSVRNNEDGKKPGRGKASLEKVLSQESLDDSAGHEDIEVELPKTSAKRKRSSAKDKEIVPSSESPVDAAEHGGNEMETPKTSAKRKRSSVEYKVTETVASETLASENVPSGAALIGSKVKVWWPMDEQFYEGFVTHYSATTKKHKVCYTDGEVEKLILEDELWELLEDNQASERELVESDDAAIEGLKKKKTRNAESSAKLEKLEASPKSKSKDTATKSGQKPKDDGKTKLNLKDVTPKSGDIGSSKSKARSKKAGKSLDDGEKRSKDASMSTSKPSSKEEPIRAAIKSGNKTPQSGGKPSANGMEKLKLGSSKVKESGNKKEKTTVLVKTPDSMKEKVSAASKQQESEPKSGKKRARGKS